MTNEELKKKIKEILRKRMTELLWSCHTDEIPLTEEGAEAILFYADELADALIAAGIGDVSELKKHRVVVEKSLIPEDDNAYVLPNISPTVKQLYSDEEVDKIVIERAEYKHRAEVAENELKLYKLAVKIWQERYSDIRCFNFNIALKQAEKELAEEWKDD